MGVAVATAQLRLATGVPNVGALADWHLYVSPHGYASNHATSHCGLKGRTETQLKKTKRVHSFNTLKRHSAMD